MDDPLPPDPYKALGIAKDAPLAAVRSAHRKLVLTCHPDKVTDEAAKKTAADKFHLVQQAYEILSDETRRQRYDERARLTELRAEMGKDKMGPRIVPEYAPRHSNKSVFEMRGNTMYEERAPRRAYEDDDYFQPRYQEARPRNFDDRSFVPPPRKTSGRGSEDKRARDIARELEEDHERRRKDAARADEKAARLDRDKKRDKDKRREYERKSMPRFAPYAEDDTDSDSDYTERVYARREEPPKRRYEEDIRKRERDIPIRSSKREDDHSFDDSKHARVADFAQDYIAKSRNSVEPEPRRPAPYSRSYSHVEPRSAQHPPPPPPPPIPPIDPKRSSARARSRKEPSPPPRLSKKDRRMTEIVDPPPSSRRPSLPFFPSDPKGLKIPLTPSSRRGPSRSQTLDQAPEPKHPSITRAGTEPIDRSRLSDQKIPLSARAKEQHDSGYSSRSSRGTPDRSPSASPQRRSTRHKIIDDSDDSGDEITVVPGSDGGYQRYREVSPKARRPPSTPHSTSSMRMPPMRSGSYVIPGDQPPTPRTAPAFIRTESGRPPPLKARPSARGTGQLYGEVPGSDDTYRIVNQSPRLKNEDVKYASYAPRKGSEDMDRDAYPGSHHRPGFTRQESRAVRT